MFSALLCEVDKFLVSFLWSLKMQLNIVLNFFCMVVFAVKKLLGKSMKGSWL